MGHIQPMNKTTRSSVKKRSVTGLGLPTVEKAKKKSTVPTKGLEGDQVRRLTEALLQIKAAEAVVNELKPDLLQEGIEYVFEHNVEHGGQTKELISSVKLFDVEADPNEEGSDALMVSVQKKVGVLNKDVVNEALTRMTRTDGKKADANDYVQFAVKASFDTSVFNDEEGNFDKDRYKKVMEALTDVSAELGVENPLSCHEIMTTRGDFHEKRWTDFTLEDNLILQSDVIPCTVSLKSVAPVNGE